MGAETFPHEGSSAHILLGAANGATGPASGVARLPDATSDYGPELVTAPIIWVVEDDGGLRSSLCDLMRSAGYVSEAFASAEEILNMATLARVDCIVTDIHMSGPTGIELLRMVKAWHANVAVIVMTADADLRWRAKAVACGAEAFLEKPFDPVKLLELIAANVGRDAPRC